MDTGIMVSICCITYNQEKYIADALEGFLKQKTTFKYEILVHDDASPDKTADVIREYEEKNPELIRAIYQSENKYSKGIIIWNTYLFPAARGKYIAICEGDDYWTDPYKLQKQVDYMEAHPECTFCFTNGTIKDERGKEADKIFVPYSDDNEKYVKESGIYDLGECALLGFVPTATFFFPKSVMDDFPEFYSCRCGAGDLKMKLHAASKGYSYFLNDCTSVYRANVPGSLMTQWKDFGGEVLADHFQSYVELVDAVDKYTDYKYAQDLEELRFEFEHRRMLAIGDKKILKNEKYMKMFRNMRVRSKLKVIISLYCPSLYRVLMVMLTKIRYAK